MVYLPHIKYIVWVFHFCFINFLVNKYMYIYIRDHIQVVTSCTLPVNNKCREKTILNYMSKTDPIGKIRFGHFKQQNLQFLFCSGNSNQKTISTSVLVAALLPTFLQILFYFAYWWSFVKLFQANFKYFCALDFFDFFLISGNFLKN